MYFYTSPAYPTSEESQRFLGLFGMYFSLQYLSLSDAVVLTFLSPFCTGVAGSIFLGESFTLKAAAASRENWFYQGRLSITFSSVFSLSGVVLIARPAFLFGDVVPMGGNTSKLEVGTPAQRLMAVMSAKSFRSASTCV
jgi:drug/metabolite transporter (DMT)-like permease